MDWVLQQGPSPNYPNSGPEHERHDGGSSTYLQNIAPPARDYGCHNDTDGSLLETMTIFEGNNTVTDCLAYNRAMEGSAGRWSGLKNGFVLQCTARIF